VTIATATMNAMTAAALPAAVDAVTDKRRTGLIAGSFFIRFV